VNLLLDTHVFLWWDGADAALNADARAMIRSPDHEVFVSAVSVWEIAIKRRLGKLAFLGGAGLGWVSWRRQRLHLHSGLSRRKSQPALARHATSGLPFKSVLGFRQFLLRGFDKVRGEWSLVTMAWNMKRMFALAWTN